MRVMEACQFEGVRRFWIVEESGTCDVKAERRCQMLSEVCSLRAIERSHRYQPLQRVLLVPVMLVFAVGN